MNQDNFDSREPSEYSANSNVRPSVDQRRGFLGSNFRNRVSMDRTALNVTHSHFNDTTSVMSGDENEKRYDVLWGTNINVYEIESTTKKFFQEFVPFYSSNGFSFYMEKLHQAYKTENYSIKVDASHIHEYNKKLYNLLIYYPTDVILIFDKALLDLFKSQFLSEEEVAHFEHCIMTKVDNLIQKSRMRELNPKDINHLLSITGIVIKTSDIYPEMKDAIFRCCKCKHISRSALDQGRVTEPIVCPTCGARFSFELIHNLCMFADKQFVKMQETPEVVPEGETPQNVRMIVYDEMVDGCKPGDRVEITGILKAQSNRISKAKRTLMSVFTTYIDVICITSTTKSKGQIRDDNEGNLDEEEEEEDVQLTPEDISRIKEISLDPHLYTILEESLAPSIWKNEDVKKGLLCQLFAGTKKNFALAQRTKFRNDINILLCGDPSTAKSQLLQFIHKIVPRGIYTSGKGSSAVGLTAYVTKDPDTGEIVLESGALVLSDKGICCIDEFDKMSDDTKTILHEVMEQQTISIAKNGIVCSLNARTAILAAANPKESRYNKLKSLIYNIQLPPSLFSRFDLIYLMIDKAETETDKNLAKHILSMYSSLDPMVTSQVSRQLPRDLFTKYISYARKYCEPEIPEELSEQIVQAYLQMRNRGRDNGGSYITATPRQLESLIRISEALAKMRLSRVVESKDVAEAARLIDVALGQSAMNYKTGKVDMDQIHTGMDQDKREKVGQVIPDIIKTLMEEIFKGGIRNFALKEEIMKEDPSIDYISNDEMERVLKNLQENDIIDVIGAISSDKCTIKLSGKTK